jgi:hypothetical protein
MNSIGRINTFAISLVLILQTACQNKQNHEKGKINPDHPMERATIESSQKPGSSYHDTLFFDTPIAVFYAPDSLQLEKIKETTEKWMFDGLMHEYEFQFFYSRKILKRDWPQLEIMEIHQARYLIFPGEDGNRDVIDLDKFGEPFGLIIYNGRKKASAIDMPNIEYLLPEYIAQ